MKFKNYSPKAAYYYLNSRCSNTPIRKDMDGFTIFLNPKDLGLSKQLYVKGYREPECSRLFIDYLKEGMTLIDIGSNIGYYVLLESGKIKNSSIYALEPHPDNYAYLLRNVNFNNLQNVETFNFAIGSESKKGKLYYDQAFNAASLLKTKDPNFYDVEIVTLDDFVFKVAKEIPDVIRMDVEGYEYNILKGMTELLSKGKPDHMFIELHSTILHNNGIKLLDIFNLLYNNGYLIEFIVKEHSYYKEEVFRFDYNTSKELIQFLKENKLIYPYSNHGLGLFINLRC